MATVSAIMVTYNRPEQSREVLQRCLDQTLPPSQVVVVDTGDVQFEVPDFVSHDVAIEVIRPRANIGPAGGIPLAAERLAEMQGHADGYVVLLDDDDPFVDLLCVERAVAVLETSEQDGRNIVGVGHRGSLFDSGRMRTLKPSDTSSPPVHVDSLHGGFCSVYRLEALVGISEWTRSLFWGFEELAIGLHLQEQGGRLVSFEDPSVIGEKKSARLKGRPHLMYQEPPALRRYYTLRNLLAIEKRFGSRTVALLHGLVRGVLKPLAALAFQPRWAGRALSYGVRALTDGLGNRFPYMGSPASQPKAFEFITRSAGGAGARGN